MYLTQRISSAQNVIVNVLHVVAGQKTTVSPVTLQIQPTNTFGQTLKLAHLHVLRAVTSQAPPTQFVQHAIAAA